jgi:mRNA turnover protein 4
MPRSKRSKVTTLAKTPLRSTKESKAALITQLRAAIDQHDNVWVFSVGDMRNDGLKQVRAQWRGSGRFFLGKGKVMAKALGLTPETEYQTDIYKLAQVCLQTSPLTIESR